MDEKRAILFGGFDGVKRFNDVWFFDSERKVVSCYVVVVVVVVVAVVVVVVVLCICFLL